MVVVLDEIRSAVPETIHASWHTAGNVKLKRDRKAGLITGESSALHFSLAATCSFKVRSGTHALAKRRHDHVIALSTPPVGEAVLAAAFAPRPIGKLQLRRSARGDVALRAGPIRIHWRASKKHLQLDRVEEAL